MMPQIRTVFFGADDTLRVVSDDTLFISQADTALMMLIQTRESHEALFSRLEARWEECRARAGEAMLDLSEAELWTRYLLPEYEPNMVYANAPSLTRLMRDHEGRREARPEAAQVIRTLWNRGYRLGILSNTPSETEVPDWLVADGLAQCFHTVLLSCKVRLRKPDAALYQLACRCVGTPPEACAYVGTDRAGLEGARAAGFGLCVRVGGGAGDGVEAVSSLSDLPDLLPAPPEPDAGRTP